MTTKEVTAIAIKFLAIWYLFQVIIYAPVVIAMMNTLVGYQEEGMFQIQYLILIAVFIAVGVLTAKGLFKLSNDFRISQIITVDDCVRETNDIWQGESSPDRSSNE